MPTYDYSCAGCHRVFEVFERLNAQGLRECPKCGKKRARRLLGSGASPLVRRSGAPSRASGGG